jgi:hypothetical protein
MIRKGNIERSAMLAVVLDEPEKRRFVENDRQAMQNLGRKTLFVRFVQHHGLWTVMTTTPTGDAISAIRVGRSLERSERHGRTLMQGSGVGKREVGVTVTIKNTGLSWPWPTLNGHGITETS